MADVVVNIRGNSEQLKRELNDIQNTGGGQSGSQPTGRQEILPPDNRLLEEIRRSILSQGAMFIPGSASSRQIIQQAGVMQKQQADLELNQKYSARRDDLRERASFDYKEADEEVEREKAAYIRNIGQSAYEDPLRKASIDEQFERLRESKYMSIGRRIDEEESEINTEEANERKQVDEELTEAVRELTKEFSKAAAGGGDPNSYINQLRGQRLSLIQQRDSEMTPEGAAAKQREIQSIDDKLKEVMSGGAAQQGAGKSPIDSLLAGGQGVMNLFDSMGRGDIAGSVMSGGMAISGLGGMGLKAALRLNAITALLAGGIKGIQSASESSDVIGELAGFRSTSGGLRGKEGRTAIAGQVTGGQFEGVDFSEYGLTIEDFVREAKGRIRARGTSEDWFKETIKGIGVERGLGLEAGATTRGSEFDRYGMNVTDALARMVTILSDIERSGVSSTDYTRVQEKFDIQQAIMQGYAGRTDRPNYDVANQMLAAFSSVQGITQDKRLGGDISQFQDMVRNPINDRMKALVYGSVADLFPTTGGRVDLIEQELYKSENEGKIIQAVVRRVVQQFGGPDTPMGYMTLRTLLPGIAPDRMKKEVESLVSGEAGTLLGKDVKALYGSGKLASESKEKISEWTSDAIGYLSDMTKATKSLEEFMKSGLLKITLNSTSIPNTPRSGR